MKSTPGPWTITKLNKTDIEIEGGNGNLVYCDTLVVPDETIGADEIIEETIANAHLISAAPELLDACEEVLGLLQKGVPCSEIIHNAQNVLTSAIFKAKGENI